MKKTLLLCGLGLTVATSMVAGTMAIYTHTDTFLDANGSEVSGTAKKFYINTTTNSTIGNFKLAPGESEIWDFIVTNVPTNINGYVSEVDTDLVVSLNFGEIKDWNDLKVSLIEDDKTEIELTKTDKDLVFTQENAFKAEVAATKKYSLKFTWDDSGTDTLEDAKDTDLVYGKESDLPSISGIKVTVTGKQHVE